MYIGEHNKSLDKLHRVMVAMLGARRHYAVPASLNKAGVLEHFYTDICAVSGWPKYLNYIPKSIQPAPLKRLTGRIPKGIPLRKLTSFPELGLSYAYKLTRAKSLDEQIDVFKWAGDQFAERIDRCGFGNADTVYTFDHNGLELIQKAKAMGLKTVVDITVAPLRIDHAILTEERERYPNWEREENIPADNTVELLSSLDTQAWQSADVMICGSEYVKQCVADCGGPAERCVVVPYGLRRRKPRRILQREWSGRLRVLTVGTVSLRKGAPYILEAARRLKDYASFRMVGSVNLRHNAEKEMARHINLVGAVPRSEMLKHYEWADVFLLPSLSEGSAAVIYEALAHGLPVICTPNTGSVVQDGIEGYIVQPRDVDAITERLTQLHSSHTLRREMSAMARHRAAEFTQEHYGRNLLSAISGIPQQKTVLNMQ